MNYKGETDPAQAIADKANEIQSSMVLDKGPLMKLGLFQCPDGDHLLIAIHHLLIDGVSWRILLEDFASGYEQAERGQTIQLPQKQTRFHSGPINCPNMRRKPIWKRRLRIGPSFQV